MSWPVGGFGGWMDGCASFVGDGACRVGVRMDRCGDRDGHGRGD